MRAFRQAVWRRSKRRRLRPWVWVALILVAAGGAYAAGRLLPWPGQSAGSHPIVTPGLPVSSAAGGRLSSTGTPTHLTAEQIMSQVRWRYGQAAPQPRFTVTYWLIRYTSTDSQGQPLTEYARVYVPDNLGAKVPLVSFAPGTTGLADSCATSLEQPQVHNLGDYQAHYLALASQGSVVVAPDYEGMRDPNRLHHYMVGDLEGRAVLDAIRAAGQMRPVALASNGHVYLAGYSQGGQAAAFADQIAPTYAPDLHISGYIGYAPVSDVKRTWQDILHGSTLDWFGPYVLASYSDYYHDQPETDKVLLPRWSEHLMSDVQAHCIDSAPHFWGEKPDQIYTPEFLAALADGQLAAHGYPVLAAELGANSALGDTTPTPKLLVQGEKDDVILPAQTSDFAARLCLNRAGAVSEQVIPGANHYTIPVAGFAVVWQWIQNLEAGQPAPTQCPA